MSEATEPRKGIGLIPLLSLMTVAFYGLRLNGIMLAPWHPGLVLSIISMISMYGLGLRGLRLYINVMASTILCMGLSYLADLLAILSALVLFS